MSNRRILTSLPALAVAAALLAIYPVRASADARSNCQRRVEKAEGHYRHEAREHGRHSPQAENAKSRLNAEWDRCYSEAHGWYDPHRHQWRTDRDWDRDYDWDYDHDRH